MKQGSSDQFIRTRMLLGQEAMERLSNSRVAVFGIGGVGGYAAEALARSGVGQLDLIDKDTISISNLNRQIHALHSTVGRYKVDVAKERILDIDPDCRVRTYKTFFLPDTSGCFDFSIYDYVIDAIDTVTGKLEIITRAKAAGVPVISSMGTGNKTDPAALEAADIYSTSICPLARIMRKELRKRGVESLKVVYSRETALDPRAYEELTESEKDPGRRQIPGSTAFVPAAAGLMIAAEVIKDIIGFDKRVRSE